MARGDAAHGPLEQDGFVDRAQRIGPVFERDLELPRRVFGHQRAHGQPQRFRGRIEIVEQRRHVVEAAEAIRVDAAATLAAQHARPKAPAGRPHPVRAGRTRVRRRPPASALRLRSARRPRRARGADRPSPAGRPVRTCVPSTCAVGRLSQGARASEPATGRQHWSASPTSQTSPVPSTSSPVMSRPRIEPATLRPLPYSAASSSRATFLPRPTPHASVMTSCTASMSGFASRNAWASAGVPTPRGAVFFACMVEWALLLRPCMHSDGCTRAVASSPPSAARPWRAGWPPRIR